MRISDWSSDVCSSDLAILTGVGRVPNIEGLDLEAAGVDYDKEHGIRIDDFLRTSNRRIYAAGDEIGRASCRERCVSTCSSRWSTDHYKNRHAQNDVGCTE